MPILLTMVLKVALLPAAFSLATSSTSFLMAMRILNSLSTYCCCCAVSAGCGSEARLPMRFWTSYAYA